MTAVHWHHSIDIHIASLLFLRINSWMLDNLTSRTRRQSFGVRHVLERRDSPHYRWRHLLSLFPRERTSIDGGCWWRSSICLHSEYTLLRRQQKKTRLLSHIDRSARPPFSKFYTSLPIHWLCDRMDQKVKNSIATFLFISLREQTTDRRKNEPVWCVCNRLSGHIYLYGAVFLPHWLVT